MYKNAPKGISCDKRVPRPSPFLTGACGRDLYSKNAPTTFSKINTSLLIFRIIGHVTGMRSPRGHILQQTRPLLPPSPPTGACGGDLHNKKASTSLSINKQKLTYTTSNIGHIVGMRTLHGGHLATSESFIKIIAIRCTVFCFQEP